MKVGDVRVGGVYDCRVSERIAPVKITERALPRRYMRRGAHFKGINLLTNRVIRLSARRCRRIHVGEFRDA